MVAYGLADRLRRYGVHAGHPDKLEALVQLLQGQRDPITARQVERIWRELRGVQRTRNPAGLLAIKLADGSWRTLMADLEAQDQPDRHRDIEENHAHLEQSEARQLGLDRAGYEAWRWRRCVADWVHRGWPAERIQNDLGASPAEQQAAATEFPPGAV